MRYYKEDNEMDQVSVWKIENIDKFWMTQDGDEISLLIKNGDDLKKKIILTGKAIKNHNDNFITTLKVDADAEAAQDLAEINHLKDELNRLQRENEDLKNVLWYVADKVKNFKEDENGDRVKSLS